MNAITDALRKRFKSPREVIEQLGLDESLLTRENLMATTKPTRLANVALRLTARAVNPLLAMDAKVDYAPIFKGLTSKTFDAKKLAVAIGAAIKGKTIAKDASMEHVASMLDHLEHTAKEEPASADESVSEEEHRAMEAAAHGHSTLGIPKNVGEEFSEADKGKGFDAMRGFLKDRGMSDDDIEALHGMMPEPAADRHGMDVHHYHGARDAAESEEDRTKREKEAEDRAQAKDAKHHHHYANDEEGETEEERKKREAEDSRRRAADSARDKNMVTKDEMSKSVADAVAAERKNQAEIRLALDEAVPLVGRLNSDLTFDSADDVRRHILQAAGKRGFEKTTDSAALKAAVAMLEPAGTRTEHRGALAMDADAAKDFKVRFPGSERIRAA